MAQTLDSRVGAEPLVLRSRPNVDSNNWNQQMVYCILLVDGVEARVARSVSGLNLHTGHSEYTRVFSHYLPGQNSAVWVGNLAAGTHTFKVQYRSWTTIQLNPTSTGFEAGGMQVIALDEHA